ncbi:B12-binding domain-containing radical SAM protein [Chloroflexota bacterium]
MIDVLFINPPHSFPANPDETLGKGGYALYPPAGVLNIAAALKQAGFSAEVIDIVAAGQSLNSILDEITARRPSIVGLTVTTPQLPGAVRLATMIKERFGGDLSLCIGGPHISADPDFFHRFPIFDFALTGEGEITFPELVKIIAAGERVSGVYQGQPVNDLDTLPFPDRSLINREDYIIAPYGKDFVTVHPTRGCSFDCSFCSNPVGGRQSRFRSPCNVVDEIEYCVNEYAVKHVLFTDDTFTLNMKRAAEICDELITRKFDVTWSCETRAGLVNHELLTLMHRAGCREISFGVETGSEELRTRVLHKKVSNAELASAFDLCHHLGIDAHAFCMLGFPGETRGDMLRTLAFVKKIRPDVIGLHLTVLFPGSDLYKEALAEGMITADIWDKFARGEVTEQPVYVPDGFTKCSLEKMQKYIYWRYYYHPAYLLRRLFKDFSSFSRLRQDIRLGIGLLFSPRTKTGRP